MSGRHKSLGTVLAATGVLSLASITVLAGDSPPEVTHVREFGTVDAGHASQTYVAVLDGTRAELRGLAAKPYECSVSGNGAPIAFPCGPNPYASPCVLLVVGACAGFKVDLLSEEQASLASFQFEDVAPGPYMLRVSGHRIKAAVYWIQVSWNGIVLGKAPYVVRA